MSTEQARCPSPGQRVRQARNARDLTQDSLAATLGVTKSFVSDLEWDRRAPSEAVGLKLAAALDLDADELLIGWRRPPKWALDVMARWPRAAKRALARLREHEGGAR